MTTIRNIIIALLFSSVLVNDASSDGIQCLLTPLSNYCSGCYFSLFEQYNPTKCNNLGPIKDTAPPNSKAYSRYKKPLTTIDFSWVSPALCKYITQKNWQFITISTSNYFIATSIINFNYAANAFAYIYDRVNQKFYQYATKSLLAIDLKEQMNSSIGGCMNYYRSSKEFIRHCYNQQTNQYEIKANVSMNNNIPVSLDFKIDFTSINDQSMVLLYPIKQDRPAYTHKTATLSTKGSMIIGNTIQENLLEGTSSGDWTLSNPKRITRWKWISLSTLTAKDFLTNENVKLGINLSDEIYNDKNDISMENAIWINGQVYTIDERVNIISPSEQFLTTQPWQVSSPSKLNLLFQPKSSHEEHENLIVINIDFVQVIGVFSGTIQMLDKTYTIENSWGVVESHYAKW